MKRICNIVKLKTLYQLQKQKYFQQPFKQESIDFLCHMVKHADELDISAHIKVTISRHTLVRYIFEDDYLEEYFSRIYRVLRC